MDGSVHRWIRGVLLALAALGAAQAQAQAQAQEQAAAYRCGPRTYSQVACTGGRPIGMTRHRVTDKSKAPPQDRAVAARRAALSPGQRQECRGLDLRLREERRTLRAKGEAVTLDDEMPLVHAQKRFRELKC